jgi:dolichol-phosphate mannosyltransferase
MLVPQVLNGLTGDFAMVLLLDQLSAQGAVTPKHPVLELSVVIPTYKERQNIAPLLAALQTSLQGINWEVIFVDDHSPDHTADEVRALALSNPRVRILERIGRRGLSSACIEGMMASPAPSLAVMDADMQHDETALPEMLRLLQEKHLDVVVASRRVKGGSMGEFASERVRLSDLGSRVSRLVCNCDVTDPMSGFFVVDSQFFRAAVPRLTGTGFKLLVDILASSSKPPRIAEVPYRFRKRLTGESKLDVNIELEYLFLILDKIVGRYLPTRFVLFVAVGSLGLLIHLSILAVFHLLDSGSFAKGQVVATLGAMMFNFFLNNVITFRDRRLKGWALARGLVTFSSACTLGVLINVSFADRLLAAGLPWYLAGLSGVVISSFWNYGVNTIVTWRRNRERYCLVADVVPETCIPANGETRG